MNLLKVKVRIIYMRTDGKSKSKIINLMVIWQECLLTYEVSFLPVNPQVFLKKQTNNKVKRERQKKDFPLVDCIPHDHNDHGCSRSKPGASNAIQISHINDRYPGIVFSCAAFPVPLAGSSRASGAGKTQMAFQPMTLVSQVVAEPVIPQFWC